MQALVNGALQSGSLQCFATAAIQFGRRPNLYDNRELRDSPRCIFRHVLYDRDRAAGQLQGMPLSDDTHDCKNAASQCSRNQISWRKSLAFTVVVRWSVGGDLALAWAVRCFAAQLSLVFNFY